MVDCGYRNHWFSDILAGDVGWQVNATNALGQYGSIPGPIVVLEGSLMHGLPFFFARRGGRIATWIEHKALAQNK